MDEKKNLRIQEVSGASCINLDFHRNKGGNRGSSQPRTALWKQTTPSKWDDAQKWLVNLSRGDKNPPTKASPRNSSSDDRRLIAPPKGYPIAEKECDSSSTGVDQLAMETKNVQCEEPIWRINKRVHNSKNSAVGCVSVRDMGTEMTPIGSQEPSRTATPIRMTTPVTLSPNSSGSSSPIRGGIAPIKISDFEKGAEVLWAKGTLDVASSNERYLESKTDVQQSSIVNPLETRAMAWDEAERAKYMARYKREEMKIQAWENHQKMKAEMEMRKVEAKAERLKTRAQEKCAIKLATVQRIAEEGRANAEAKLNKKALKTSERTDYIRRTGHLPWCFSHKLPSYCW